MYPFFLFQISIEQHRTVFLTIVINLNLRSAIHVLVYIYVIDFFFFFTLFFLFFQPLPSKHLSLLTTLLFPDQLNIAPPYNCFSFNNILFFFHLKCHINEVKRVADFKFSILVL